MTLQMHKKILKNLRKICANQRILHQKMKFQNSPHKCKNQLRILYRGLSQRLKLLSLRSKKCGKSNKSTSFQSLISSHSKEFRGTLLHLFLLPIKIHLKILKLSATLQDTKRNFLREKALLGLRTSSKKNWVELWLQKFSRIHYQILNLSEYRSHPVLLQYRLRWLRKPRPRCAPWRGPWCQCQPLSR